MSSNYKIHEPNEDSYYYCPNDECPCNGSSTHRNDLIFDLENAYADFKRVFPDYD